MEEGEFATVRLLAFSDSSGHRTSVHSFLKIVYFWDAEIQIAADI
jgi:hypothetical protein